MYKQIHLALGCLLIASFLLIGCGRNPGKAGGPGPAGPGQPDRNQVAAPSGRGNNIQPEVAALTGPGGNDRGPAGPGGGVGPGAGPGGAGGMQPGPGNPNNPGHRGPGQPGGVVIGGAGGNGPGGPGGPGKVNGPGEMAPAVAQQPIVPPSVQLSASSDEAADEAVVLFANEQLGTQITPVYAGQVTQEVMNLLATSLPAELQSLTDTAQNMSVNSYYGLLKGGVAALAVGDCSEGASCQLSGDIPADLSQAALGIYALQRAETMPSTPGDALQLATHVFPKLTGLEFTQAADMSGYAFSATTTSGAIENGRPTFVTKVILTGVMDVQGQTMVYAAVGLGETYANLLNPF